MENKRINFQLQFSGEKQIFLYGLVTEKEQQNEDLTLDSTDTLQTTYYKLLHKEFLNPTFARLILVFLLSKPLTTYQQVYQFLIYTYFFALLALLLGSAFMILTFSFSTLFPKMGELFGISGHSDCYSSQATKSPQILGKMHYHWQIGTD